MKKNVKNILFLALALSFYSASFTQEALKSTEEEYYDFLSLQGLVDRPTLNYRTLSDSEWTLSEEAKNDERNIWKNNNLGTKHQVSDNVAFKIYGLDWYNSYNTAASYGQNDGALWQGKGYNTSLSAGARLEAIGFEVTFKPQISFSQNKEFDIMTSNTDSEYGYFWGYSKNVGVDLPQRFGDESFATFDWGDTEIRYTWKTLTAGFGTQAVWLGPAWLNPMLSSNNAATYPKFDIGLRKTPVTLFGWYAGEIEGRIWTGYLSESDYFDNDTSNDHNLIHGLSMSYAPSFFTGLTIGLNRICLVKASENNLKYIIPMDKNSNIGEENAGEDQKFSLSLDWINTKIGFELYTELAMDDFLQGGMIYGSKRYPFDTLIWTFGLKKTILLSDYYKLYGELVIEVSDMELPRNKPRTEYSFNMHHQITQGFTNKGQAIGTALANGGNSQYIHFKVYYPKGNACIFLQRENPDDTYSYIKLGNYNNTYKAYFISGIENSYFLTPNLCFLTGLNYDFIINSLYYSYDDEGNISTTKDLTNFNFILGFKYYF